MKKIKHLLIVAVALILTCAISVAATYAYLYDKSDTAINTIAVGKVKVSLSEARVNEDGQLLDVDGNVWTAESGKDKAPRVLNNHYKLLPNRTYTKDPTIYVEEGSEPCILFVLIYMPEALENVIKYNDFADQFIANGWRVHSNIPKINADGITIGTYMWLIYIDRNTYYTPQVFSGGAIVPIFESIAVKPDASYAALKKASACEMEITAFAFQWEDLGDEVDYDYIMNSFNEAYDLYGN